MAWSNSHEVPSTAAGERLVEYLKARLIVIPVNEIGDAITGSGGTRAPDISIEGRETRTDSRLAAGDRLLFETSLEARLTAENRLTLPADLPLDVAYEDGELLVLNKPAGMHVHPVGRYRDATLLNALVYRAGARPGSPWGAWRPHPAHRLDRPVSGLVLVAKSAAWSAALNDLQQRGLLVRRYLAWVDGSLREDSGTVSDPLGRDPHFDYRRAVVSVENGGQEAVTHWRVRERRADRSLLELSLDTGRTHQIRVHLATLGFPVCGDILYSRTPIAGQRGAFSATRIALHSWQVSFAHPARPDQRVELTSPPPTDLDTVSS